MRIYIADGIYKHNFILYNVILAAWWMYPETRIYNWSIHKKLALNQQYKNVSVNVNSAIHSSDNNI